METRIDTVQTNFYQFKDIMYPDNLPSSKWVSRAKIFLKPCPPYYVRDGSSLSKSSRHKKVIFFVTSSLLFLYRSLPLPITPLYRILYPILLNFVDRFFYWRESSIVPSELYCNSWTLDGRIDDCYPTQSIPVSVFLSVSSDLCLESISSVVEFLT